jgi:hypothetical protein
MPLSSTLSPESAWGLLLGAAFLGGLMEALRTRLHPAPLGDGRDRTWIVGLLLLGGSLLLVPWLHQLRNPHWTPYGQDWRDYLSYVLHFIDPALAEPFPYRYPLWAWLAALVCRVAELPPYVGAKTLSLAASALLPPALFLLGRQLVAWPLALAGAVLPILLPGMLQTLGIPSDYLFCAWLQVLGLAAGLAALRRGGTARFFLFGLATAAVMASTAKGLAFVLPASTATLAWALLARLRGRAFVGRMLLAWSLPLLLVWLVFAWTDLGGYSLEYQTFNVQRELAGHPLAARPIWGWAGIRPEQAGFWRVGDPRALLHLPRTLAFVLFPAEGRLPWEQVLEQVKLHLGGELGMPLAWLGLLLPACLSPLWTGSPARPLDRLLPALLLLSSVVALGLGVVSAPRGYRYYQSLIVLLPLLLLVGAASLPALLAALSARRAAWPWIPALLVGAWMMLGQRSPYLWRDATRDVGSQAYAPLLSELFELRDRLGPNAGIVDFHKWNVPWYLYWGRGIPLEQGEIMATPHYGARVASSTWTRRFFVFEPPQPTQDAEHRRIVDAMLADPERFRWVNRCVMEDLRPELPFEVAPEGELLRLPPTARPRGFPSWSRIFGGMTSDPVPRP